MLFHLSSNDSKSALGYEHPFTFTLKDGRECRSCLSITTTKTQGRSRFFGRPKTVLTRKYRLEACPDDTTGIKSYEWTHGEVLDYHHITDPVLKEAWASLVTSGEMADTTTNQESAGLSGISAMSSKAAEAEAPHCSKGPDEATER